MSKCKVEFTFEFDVCEKMSQTEILVGEFPTEYFK